MFVLLNVLPVRSGLPKRQRIPPRARTEGLASRLLENAQLNRSPGMGCANSRVSRGYRMFLSEFRTGAVTNSEFSRNSLCFR